MQLLLAAAWRCAHLAKQGAVVLQHRLHDVVKLDDRAQHIGQRHDAEGAVEGVHHVHAVQAAVAGVGGGATVTMGAAHEQQHMNSSTW